MWWQAPHSDAASCWLIGSSVNHGLSDTSTFAHGASSHSGGTTYAGAGLRRGIGPLLQGA
jgi:hypothetical protein